MRGTEATAASPASAPAANDPPHAAPLRARWVIDAPTDLAWFILPVVTGYLCLYAHVALEVSSFLIWWFWNVALNGPHFYATISRTYLDREEWRQRTPLLVGSLGLLLVGPLAIGLSIAADSKAPFLVFWFVQVLWAYYHVVRQHYGFLALYQRINGERSGWSNGADYWTFHVVMFAPVLSWFLQYPDVRTAIGMSSRYSVLELGVIGLTGPLVATTAALYAVKEMIQVVRTGWINIPKTLLLGAYVPFHLLLLLRPAAVGGYDFLLFNAAITLPHNLQYLAIVWRYNRNRYVAGAGAPRYGWAARANKSLVRFACAAAIFSCVFFYLRWYLEGQRVPFSVGSFAWANVSIGGSFRIADLVGAVWIGLVFHHQYLDQRIWKLNRDPRLLGDLKLTA